MEDAQIAYDELKAEVEDIINQIEHDPKVSSALKKYYKGTQILLSPLYKNPQIMLIGINPGAGYHKSENKNVRRLSPLEFMEYVGGKYILAQQTRKLFELAGLSISDLKNSVKTNCFFMATSKASELTSLIKNLHEYDLEIKSTKWINKLIDIIQPKLIICEGKRAFYKVIQDQNCNIEDKGDLLHTNIGNIHVIGYSRKRSFIVNKDKVAKHLKEQINYNLT